ncbi:hypothetical protein D3C71_994510 [compost metagenome]
MQRAVTLHQRHQDGQFGIRRIGGRRGDDGEAVRAQCPGIAVEFAENQQMHEGVLLRKQGGGGHGLPRVRVQLATVAVRHG